MDKNSYSFFKVGWLDFTAENNVMFVYYRQALLTTSPSLTTYSYSVDIFDLATVAYKNGLYMAIFSCSTYTKNLLYE